MARDTRVQMYVEESTRDQLQREADERDLTLSTYLYRLVDRGRNEELQQKVVSENDVEARLEQTIEDTIAEYHDDLLDAVRKASVYSIANYELDAYTDDAPGAIRRDTFATGRQRTHTPLSEHFDTGEGDGSEGDQEPDSDDENDLLDDIRSGQ